jgi:predicted RNA-binding Zn-ribbon protein involved in translation (DUF1610 family)
LQKGEKPVIFTCTTCGQTISITGKPKTVTCSTCGTTYTLAEGSFDWGSFFWGAVAGIIFAGFIFTATGRAIMEALGYRVIEKVKPS